jgi:probable rRNA maturation factor
MSAESNSVAVDLQVACDVDQLPSQAEIRAWLQAAFRAGSRQHAGHFDVSVRIVDEGESRQLNLRYRQQDEATNVLAFPAGSAGEISGLPEDEVQALGDLVICGPLVEQEAAQQGKAIAGHWGHLLVHGMLHLLGYDHQTSGGAAEMETMEKRILAERGVADPYRGAEHDQLQC